MIFDRQFNRLDMSIEEALDMITELAVAVLFAKRVGNSSVFAKPVIWKEDETHSPSAFRFNVEVS